MSEHELCLRINMLVTAYLKRRHGEWHPLRVRAQGLKLSIASDKWVFVKHLEGGIMPSRAQLGALRCCSTV